MLRFHKQLTRKLYYMITASLCTALIAALCFATAPMAYAEETADAVESTEISDDSVNIAVIEPLADSVMSDENTYVIDEQIEAAEPAGISDDSVNNTAIKPLAGTAPETDFTFTTSTINGVTYAYITKYKGPGGDVVIPGTLGGSTVKEIRDSAFSSCMMLTSVTIPNGVTSIGYDAFSSCPSMKSVTIPDSVTDIRSRTFASCTSLQSIVLPKGLSSISDGLCKNCTSLKSVTIPDSIMSIGRLAFYNCSNLASIAIPNGVTSIDDWTFYGCSSLVSITVPNGVTSIGGNAFQGCTALTSVTIPDGVTSIGFEAFGGCTSLESIVLPKGLTSISQNLCYGCTNLKNVTLPASITCIDDCAFLDCTALANVTLPNGVIYIGECAFQNCTALTTVTIPDGVTSIGFEAFSGCANLASITIPASVTSIGEDAFVNCPKLTIYGPESSSVQLYAVARNIPFQVSANQSGSSQPGTPVSAIRSAQTTFYVVAGKTLTIPYAYDLQDGSTAKPVFTWSSDKPQNVSVNSATGKVKGVKAGASAKITLTADNGKSKTFTVKVVKKALMTTKVSVTKPPKTMKAGQTKDLKIKIGPAKATGAVVAFSIDKKSKKYITVDKAGRVTAIAKGTAKIMVKAGGVKTVVTIKVN